MNILVSENREDSHDGALEDDGENGLKNFLVDVGWITVSGPVNKKDQTVSNMRVEGKEKLWPTFFVDTISPKLVDLFFPLHLLMREKAGQ